MKHLKYIFVGIVIMGVLNFPTYVLAAPTFQVDTDGTLTTSLAAYWKMDDATGATRVDSWGAYNLTDVNSVVQGTGKVNQDADFGTSNTTDYFYVNGANPVTSFDADYSMACWYKINTEPALNTFYILYTEGHTIGISAIKYKDVSGTKRLTLERYNGINDDLGNYDVTLGTANFVHIMATYVFSTKIMTLYVNNASHATLTGHAGSAGGYNLGFSMDTDGDPNLGNFLGDFQVDECGVWNKVLSAQERTDLYNGGSGQTLLVPASAQPIQNKPIIIHIDYKFEMPVTA